MIEITEEDYLTFVVDWTDPNIYKQFNRMQKNCYSAKQVFKPYFISKIKS